MQSSYGGVSEIQQFMVESCGGSTPSSSLFSNTADIHSTAAGGSNPLKYQAPPPGAVLPPHFAHFHSIPITQQLFQQPPPAGVHQFQLFHPHHHQQLNYQPLEPRRMQMPHHQQLGLNQDSGPENSASSARVAMQDGGGGGPPPSFLAEAMNFKLAVNESSGGGSREGINDEDGILRGDDDGSESRLHQHWPQRDDESSIKELSWRPLDLDIDYINTNNKRCKNKEPESSINTAGVVSKKISKEDAGAGSSNYKIFSELEAIYKPGGSGGGGVNQTGSGSALTGDETPLLHAAAMVPPGLPSGADCVGGMSETSAGEEAGRPGKKFSNNRNSSGRRKRKRRRWQRQLSSVAAFFESLVKQLMDHQESLHRKFLEAMENSEQERHSREEAWRKQEAAKSCREAAARAHESKLASSREAAIVAFLEKITGESLNLPPKPQFSNEHNSYHKNNLLTDPYTEEAAAFGDQESNKVQFSTSRWPKTEVQALIRVRSGLESRFQEPGLKGPLWEEVSATMSAMGYLRSAKRCKEKWENINKYFRKTKESGKKRPQHSKTCPYFQQLDQLYSRSSLNHDNNHIPKKQRLTDQEHDSKEKHDGTEDKPTDNSELLDAIIVVPPAAADYPSLKFGFDFNDNVADENLQDGEPAPNLDNNDDENEEGEEQGGEEAEGHQEKEEEEEEEEEEGEIQEQEVDEELHDTSLFFHQRLQS